MPCGEAVMSTDSLREGLAGMRFRSKCFRVVSFSGRRDSDAASLGQRSEVALSDGSLFTRCPRTSLVRFCRNVGSCRSENAVTSAGAVRVECFFNGVVGLTLSHPNCLPLPTDLG